MIAITSGDSRPCHSRDSRSQELQQEGQEVKRIGLSPECEWLYAFDSFCVASGFSRKER